VRTLGQHFQRYTNLETGNWVKVIGGMGPEEAKAEILTGVKRYKGAKTKPKF
jgi:inorganic pyrophosphatase